MKKVTVFGAARSGVAAANFLARRGVAVTLTDNRQRADLPLVETLHPSVRQVLGGHPSDVLAADTIVLSPGIPRSIPPLQEAERRGIPVISEIELAFRHLQGKVVAITGTNGKSTTTALIGEILRVAGMEPIVAGNIGESLVASLDDKPRNYVIELSSFQLETVDSFRADVALLLNVTPDHLDRYGSMEEYAKAKYRVFRNQTASDFAVVNADDQWTREPQTSAQVWRFSGSRAVAPGAWFDGSDLVRETLTSGRIPRKDLRIEGSANVENALAAWLAANALGVGDDQVREAFRSFAGLPHRMVLVRELDGVRYINDSKGTNVDATLKSLEGMQDGRVLLILGGKDKAGEFFRLRDLVQRKVRQIITIGAAAPKVTEQLGGAAEIIDAHDMPGAVGYARQHGRSGETVLLSPACASFDQYNNFEERGAHFEQLVAELSAGDAR
jgi:UDP-N-acetylmuramoylalanine--D-glutamate ligase